MALTDGEDSATGLSDMDDMSAGEDMPEDVTDRLVTTAARAVTNRLSSPGSVRRRSEYGQVRTISGRWKLRGSIRARC
jgi:hypothetical protein